MLRIAMFVVPVVLCLYCVVEAISSRDDEVRNLPKVLWIVLILFFPFVGSIAWLAAGRPQAQSRRLEAWEREATDFPEYDRHGRFAAAAPEADSEFLRTVRERAEEQRRKGQEMKRAEEEARRRAEGDQEEPDDSAGNPA